jgi:hypothetical protein
MGLRVFYSTVLAAAFVVITNVFLSPALPQDEKEAAKKPSAPDHAKNMELYAKANVLGDRHKMVTSWAGTWDLKFVMDGLPGESTGTVQYRPILGGRFIAAESAGKMTGMETDGRKMEMPWEGFQIIGYDNVLAQYQSIWCDSMGTGMWFSTGSEDATGKVITFEGPVKDAVTPEGRPFKLIIKIESDDRHTIEIWDAKDGKTMVRNGVMTETRRK